MIGIDFKLGNILNFIEPYMRYFISFRKLAELTSSQVSHKIAHKYCTVNICKFLFDFILNIYNIRTIDYTFSRLPTFLSEKWFFLVYILNTFYKNVITFNTKLPFNDVLLFCVVKIWHLHFFSPPRRLALNCSSNNINKNKKIFVTSFSVKNYLL